MLRPNRGQPPSCPASPTHKLPASDTSGTSNKHCVPTKIIHLIQQTNDMYELKSDDEHYRTNVKHHLSQNCLKVQFLKILL